ncbi:MAG: ABC transporter substrate-binding protein [Bdellovibrionales bacterium]|jgi:phospholipid transport system substrate-binding protein|nr:ABC transporter substrate-binding protein [Bdellovibrionales bacterium]
MTTFSLTRRVMMLGMAFAMLMPAAAMAQKKTDPAVAFVQKMGDAALTELTDKGLKGAEREKRVRDLLRKNFDVQTIGRAALGTHWRSATEAQRKEYLSLFEDMIVRTYAQRFGEYTGQQFKVNSSKPTTNARDTIVSSQVIQQGGPPLLIEWRVRNNDGQYKVIDVFIENISMMITQRSDFDAVIQRNGIDGLLDSLRKRQK